MGFFYLRFRFVRALPVWIFQRRSRAGLPEIDDLDPKESLRCPFGLGSDSVPRGRAEFLQRKNTFLQLQRSKLEAGSRSAKQILFGVWGGAIWMKIGLIEAAEATAAQGHSLHKTATRRNLIFLARPGISHSHTQSTPRASKKIWNVHT